MRAASLPVLVPQSFDGPSSSSPSAAASIERVITEAPRPPPASNVYQAGYKQVDLPQHHFGNDIGGSGAPEFDRETRPAHIPGQQQVRKRPKYRGAHSDLGPSFTCL